MDVNRAQEILNSNEIIGVQLEGESVWIDSVNENNETAQVHAVDDPSEQKSVPVDQLNEV